MIVVDLENNVIASAEIIERINTDKEKGLIKVNVYPEQEFGYYLIGTQDRDSYIIYTDTTQPDPDKVYKFFVLEDGTYQYEEVEQE